MFKNYINSKKQNIISSVCDLITFPSVSVKNDDTKYPFGKDCNDALLYFLHLASSLGFRTKNVDGYCGWAEFGDGDELIGIIGHLDVVPAIEEDWEFSPFTPTIKNNCIYGRGAIDDKGPVISCLYAMKSVMNYITENNLTFNKRVRLIVGLNEEKDWECINYYKINEEIPSIGFSPDADFPCIYAEKGVLSILLSEEINKIENSFVIRKILNRFPAISIIEADCNNNAINVVPKICSVTLQLNAKNISITSVIDFLKITIKKLNYEIDIYKMDNSHLKLTSYGMASHSAHPDLGVNSISKMLVLLNLLFTEYKIKDYPLIDDFCNYIGDDYLGTNMNLNIEDESGFLTLNTSKLYIQNNKLYIGINLRIPVKTPIDNVIDIFEKNFSKESVSIISKIEPLYINKDNSLVKTLCNIFNEECKTDFEPIAIGGATYARAFPNCISFGMNFPKDKDMCHQVDEYISIDKLILSTNIYAKAIYELLKD